MVHIFIIFAIIFPAKIFAALRSGFWYGETRPPETQYDSVPYANMTVKINQAYQDGPGSNLVKDPFDPTVCSLFMHGTVIPCSFVLCNNCIAIGI